MANALRAFGRGVAAVLLAPHLVLAALLVTLLAAAPFAAWLGVTLQEAMPPEGLTPSSAEIDAEWWLEFRRHATGLAATFTPAIVGFAAPLSNLSAILDGTMPLVMILPAAVAVIAWAFLWGGLLHRFAHGRLMPARFLRAATGSWGTFTLIALVAAVAQLALYLTVHPLLFRLLFPALAGPGTPEPTAVVTRAAFYVVFGACLVMVTLVADYARGIAAVTGERRVGQLLSQAWQFIRRHTAATVTLYLLTGMLFVIMFVTYGIGDTIGGTRVGGWRAVAIGQLYIAGRLVIRLIFGASEVRLLQAYGERPAPPASS